MENNPFARGFRANGGKVRNPQASMWSRIDADHPSWQAEADGDEHKPPVQNEGYFTSEISRDYFGRFGGFQGDQQSTFWHPPPQFSQPSSVSSHCSFYQHCSNLPDNDEPDISNNGTNSRCQSNSSDENNTRIVKCERKGIFENEFPFWPNCGTSAHARSSQNMVISCFCEPYRNVMRRHACPSHSLRIANYVVDKNQDSCEPHPNEPKPFYHPLPNQYVGNSIMAHPSSHNAIFPNTSILVEQHPTSDFSLKNTSSDCASETTYFC